jgi:hypothetical protein
MLTLVAVNRHPKGTPYRRAKRTRWPRHPGRGIRCRAAADMSNSGRPHTLGRCMLVPAPRARKAASNLQALRLGLLFTDRRNWTGGRRGSVTGFHPAIVLAHCRACSLSVSPGNRRRNSTAEAASSSETTNIPQAWKRRSQTASDGLRCHLAGCIEQRLADQIAADS